MRRRHSTPTLEPLEGRSLMSSTGPGPLPAPPSGNSTGPAYLVVCEGNSLTYGRGTLVPSAQSYPGQLQGQLGAGWKVLNLGIPAQTTEQMLSRYQDTFARISAIQGQLPYTKRHRALDVVWEGTNSLRVYANGQSAALRMRQFVALRHAEHFKVIVLTCLPANDPKEVKPDFEPQRKIYNALIRKNVVGADLVVDIASDYRLTDPNSAYYASDHFHLSQNGYAVVSDLIAHAVQRLEKAPPRS